MLIKHEFAMVLASLPYAPSALSISLSPPFVHSLYFYNFSVCVSVFIIFVLFVKNRFVQYVHI